MSRVGKEPIKIPEKVSVTVDGKTVKVKGPKGEIEQNVSKRIKVEVKDGEVILTRENDLPRNKAKHGLYRALIQNMVTGVVEGYSKRLQIKGLGYKVSTKGPQKLELHVGFVHPVELDAPEGISFSIDGEDIIVVEGINKELVGNTAARIRSIRPPEPYKGKGIRYENEIVKIKTPRVAKTEGEE